MQWARRSQIYFRCVSGVRVLCLLIRLQMEVGVLTELLQVLRLAAQVARRARQEV